jgi:hypothetical protein
MNAHLIESLGDRDRSLSRLFQPTWLSVSELHISNELWLRFRSFDLP